MKPLVYRKSRKAAKTQPRPNREKTWITKGDTVQVISGEHKGQRGTVLRVIRKYGRVVVDGVNVVKKHRSAQRSGEETGIIEFPAPIDVSNVMLIDPKTDEPTRVRRKKDKDGTIERISVKSGQTIPRNA